LSLQPSSGDRFEERPQTLEAPDFRWLLAHGANHLALELYGLRCDCPEWRSSFYRSLLPGDCSLDHLQRIPEQDWSSLHDSPSEAMRCWDRLLRSARIKPEITGDRITLKPMSDDEVLAVSHGEVTKPETFNHRTKKPCKDGIFCEKIFGPIRDWECYCGKYKGTRFNGLICERCGVDVTRAAVRRERMGHIELPAPVVHSWYLKGPSRARLAELLHLTEEDISQTAACARYVVTDPGTASLQTGQLLKPDEWTPIRYGNPRTGAHAVTGGEALEFLLRRAPTSRTAHLSVEGIVMRRLPVCPPGLRPMIQLPDGSWATSDHNNLYRRVIDVANRLRRLIRLDVPEILILEARVRLQRNVAQLLDNACQQKPAYGPARRKLSSLASYAAGLGDNFVRRLIDCSARTRLVTGSTPDLDTALLPAQLAWDLFQPIIINALTDTGKAPNARVAKRLVDAHAAEALPTLRAICATAFIVVSLPSGPWRLLALRVQLTNELALRVHPGLLDHIGWHHLGEPVKLFGILASEAAQEAADLLTVSRLLSRETTFADDTTSQASVFHLAREEVEHEIAWAALNRRSFPLSNEDHLLLCRWPMG
jgi:DNA-directed RNA polymerase subunit beta'